MPFKRKRFTAEKGSTCVIDRQTHTYIHCDSVEARDRLLRELGGK